VTLELRVTQSQQLNSYFPRWLPICTEKLLSSHCQNVRNQKIMTKRVYNVIK